MSIAKNRPARDEDGDIELVVQFFFDEEFAFDSAVIAASSSSEVGDGSSTDAVVVPGLSSASVSN